LIFVFGRRNERRQVAQVMHRVLALAVYPMRLISANPLPRGWLPSPGNSKALTFLYPDEDAKLLGCTDVPLAHRLFYGFLAREGMRKSEALALSWRDVDRVRGAVSLDRNKTDDPRAWALDPGVAEALRRWHELSGKPVDEERVFAALGDVNIDTLRGHLRTATFALPASSAGSSSSAPRRASRSGCMICAPPSSHCRSPPAARRRGWPIAPAIARAS
jgi:integrase